MKKTLTVEGMMCEHCEARVKKALEALDGVTEAKPDRNSNLVEITLEKDVDDEKLKQTVEAEGYRVK